MRSIPCPVSRHSNPCCGHDETPFLVFFFATSVAALEPILRALDHQWHVRHKITLIAHTEWSFYSKVPSNLRSETNWPSTFTFNNTEDTMAKIPSTRHYIVRDKITNTPVALIEAVSVAQGDRTSGTAGIP